MKQETYSPYNSYSTEEIRIGTWFGKPLYRKVYTLPVMPNAQRYVINIFVNEANIIKAKKYECFLYDANDTLSPINYISAYTAGNDIGGILQGDGKLVIQPKAPFSFTGGYLILEYTKTTD